MFEGKKGMTVRTSNSTYTINFDEQTISSERGRCFIVYCDLPVKGERWHFVTSSVNPEESAYMAPELRKCYEAKYLSSKVREIAYF